MPILKTLATTTAAGAALAGAGWKYYTRDTHFVPFTPTSPSFASWAGLMRARNPQNNPPACIDHAVRRVALADLRTDDVEALTRGFCAGVWSGLGFAYQRRFLEKKYRALERRDDHLWDAPELAASDYKVGTKIADHFEVVERAPGRVAVRCGDSPLNAGPRPSDGIFSMEVDKDDKFATFHMKSYFFNSTPEGAVKGQLPWWFEFLHREYAKLWMETSVRRLLK
ncbi:hypothetical protein GTA08_BOTSDO11951 [Neofusicoccum parvum]|uniref:Uncharacterized protein n=1 Tax=Botryosphaeria parva (strain UCR-NP2) TaxID=1287680 RepID=R1GCZ0_BOTPV|nr:hypothetical protein UCRNP2_9513 [Neofusicoccum parvum UCRNP2]GME65258.1 hypothetical protein GTA08_BOTSDO11951 [Neofusicoccum parvum]